MRIDLILGIVSEPKSMGHGYGLCVNIYCLSQKGLEHQLDPGTKAVTGIQGNPGAFLVHPKRIFTSVSHRHPIFLFQRSQGSILSNPPVVLSLGGLRVSVATHSPVIKRL